MLAQHQEDNVTEWDIGAHCWQLDFSVGQHYKATMSVRALSQGGTHLEMTSDVARR